MSTDYQPYGIEWEAEMMKWRKFDIIDLLRQTCIQNTKHPEPTPLICECGDHIDGDYAFVDGKYLCPVCK